MEALEIIKAVEEANKYIESILECSQMPPYFATMPILEISAEQHCKIVFYGNIYPHIEVWNSKHDTRFFSSHCNAYEPLKDYLIRMAKELLNEKLG